MPKPAEQPDPIAQYVEWTEHRYDPGHYLGGTIRPHLRKQALGSNARKRAGVLIAVMALLPAAIGVPAIASGEPA